MKTSRLFSVALAVVLLAAPARAEFFDKIKDTLTDPAVQAAPKYTALYFSAHWCPPCRIFTPKLVAWYNEFKPKHPNFELVFVSSDRDEAAMKKYIKDTNMPWLVAKFDQRENPALQKFASDGIPYLVLIGPDGKDLTGLPGNEWQSPTQVLEKIEKIVSGS